MANISFLKHFLEKEFQPELDCLYMYCHTATIECTGVIGGIREALSCPLSPPAAAAGILLTDKSLCQRSQWVVPWPTVFSSDDSFNQLAQSSIRLNLSHTLLSFCLLIELYLYFAFLFFVLWIYSPVSTCEGAGPLLQPPGPQPQLQMEPSVAEERAVSRKGFKTKTACACSCPPLFTAAPCTGPRLGWRTRRTHESQLWWSELGCQQLIPYIHKQPNAFLSKLS